MKPSKEVFSCCTTDIPRPVVNWTHDKNPCTFHWNLFLVPEAEGAEQWQRRKWVEAVPRHYLNWFKSQGRSGLPRDPIRVVSKHSKHVLV